MDGVSRTARIVDASAKTVENLLEFVGLWRVAQRVRRRLSRYIPLEPKYCERLKMWIQAHVDLDLTVQQLVRYKWRQSYRADDSASLASEWSSDSDLVSLEDKIAAYDKSASLMQQVLQIWLDEFPDGPVKRAILSLRRNTQWEMSEWLHAQCAERDGCCARGCGCCQGPRAEVTVKGTGHCTLACLCCENNRRFSVDSSEGHSHGLLQSASSLDVYDARYHNRWVNAFVWGL